MIEMSSFARKILYLFALLIFAFLAVPILIILILSFNSGDYLTFPIQGISLRWFERIMADPVWIKAIMKSIEIAVLTTICSIILGMSTAYALVRGTFRFKKLIYALVLSPLIIPGIVSAIGLYFFCQNRFCRQYLRSGNWPHNFSFTGSCNYYYFHSAGSRSQYRKSGSDFRGTALHGIQEDNGPFNDAGVCFRIFVFFFNFV